MVWKLGKERRALEVIVKRSREAGKTFLIGLKRNEASERNEACLRGRGEMLQKSIGVCRLKNTYIKRLIWKKHLFLALKFRALKVPPLLSSSARPPSQPSAAKDKRRNQFWCTKGTGSASPLISWADNNFVFLRARAVVCLYIFEPTSLSLVRSLLFLLC